MSGRKPFFLVLCLALPLVPVLPAWSQPDQCRADIAAADGYAIRAMRVEGRWTPQLSLPGGDYSPDKVSEAIGLVRKALDADRNRDAELEGIGAVSVLHIDSCVQVVDDAQCQDAVGNPKCVDVAIRPHALRLFLVRVGSNILPIPRANRPTFFDEVPAPLLALNPTIATAYDSAFGLSLGAGISANLLDLSKTLGGEPVTPGDTKLQLQASGRKSLTEPFYNAHTDLTVSQSRFGHAIQDIAVSGHPRRHKAPASGERPKVTHRAILQRAHRPHVFPESVRPCHSRHRCERVLHGE